MCHIAQTAIAQPNISFSTYSNTDLGFIVEYPTDWIVNEDVSSGTVYMTARDIAAGLIVAFTPAENPNASLQELGDKIIETNRNSEYATGFRLIEMNTDNYFLGGQPAVRIVFVSTMEGSEKKSMALGTIIDGKEYGLMSFSDNASY